MMNAFIVILAGLVLGSLPAWGQGVLDAASGLTVEELVARALRQNGEVLAARQQIAAARGGVTQARLRANPSVEFSAMKQAAGSDNNFMLGASLPLELYGRRERRVEVAAGGVRMSELDVAERERLLRGEVESKFGEVLAALRNLQFSRELLELNRKALDLTQTRADQGAAAPLDANLLRVEVNRIDALRADFEAKLAVGLLELKSLAGMRPDDELRLKGTLEPPPFELERNAAIARALEIRADLLSARASEQVAAARRKQARTEGRPDASVSANYQRADFGFDVNGFTDTGQLRRVQGVFHEITAGVSITIPARNRNQGAIETAVAQIEEARRRREYAELIAAREVSVAFVNYTKARESLDIYGPGVRGQASENLEVIRKTYELGRTQLLDVIAEQRRFIDIETGFTETLNRYYQAAVRLRTAVGVDRP